MEKNQKMKTFKLIINRVIQAALLLFVASVIAIWFSNRAVENNAEGKTYTNLNEIPYNKVALVLGTTRNIGQRINLYYQYRIDAAADLFLSGKVDFLLISGDNSRKNYDEPTLMKKDLMLKGVPESRIYLDYAGFRTYDSVIRAKEIFGQESITVVSQKFHNERAIYTAEKKDIRAVGYNAKDVNKYYGAKTMIREKLARVKLVLDLLFGKNPKFLGEKIEIK